ncbi:hypothetical protein LLEC1_04181 [Akanthomyces lecanii]|uniref:Uncharacterized protein n=1 Tax=Cordyceps confragosa TaxID=2714763 RepID=A0A179I870_CORDF|nr:hypothetical protein LLEC1_04181 [Akanthomyces lecanii]
MCSMARVQYSCGCVKDSRFEQCELRRDTPVKCDEIRRNVPEPVQSYCLSHCMADRGRGLTKANFKVIRNGDSQQVAFKTVTDSSQG